MHDYLEVGAFKLSSRLGKERKYVSKDMDTRVPVYITRLKSSKKGSKPRLTYFAFFPVDPQGGKPFAHKQWTKAKLPTRVVSKTDVDLSSIQAIFESDFRVVKRSLLEACVKQWQVQYHNAVAQQKQERLESDKQARTRKRKRTLLTNQRKRKALQEEVVKAQVLDNYYMVSWQKL